MRLSEAWLREYVNPPIGTDDLVHQVTMAGLEVDSVTPAAGQFAGVVVGQIIETQPHPEADRLKICRVNIGRGDPLQIVCGAPNARTGLHAPLALEGAILPGDLKIKASKLRGVQSFGMLCSAKELGIDEDASGLMELPDDAPAGTDIREYLGLDDTLLELDLTPNRADCLSVEGIAREVALLNGLTICCPPIPEVVPSIPDSLRVAITAPEACPRYLGRLIRGVSRSATTPLWMKERLRRSGIRSLDVIVDVTNYVLLELGQPLHAFDAGKIRGAINVRYAEAGETLRLLNDQDITLHADTLVIADESRALALAGIMGGSESAVGEATRDIFLECAFFTPDLIMGKARRYGLSTDSSHRFERGVSFDLQQRALDRVSELIISLSGGEAGPVAEALSQEHLPERKPVLLRAIRLQRILGLDIECSRVEAILRGLGMTPQTHHEGWLVVPPAFRFDIAIEADLIEEIGRVYGYNNLPRRNPTIPAVIQPVSETLLRLDRVRDMLVDRGYQEAVTYSFVDRELQQAIDPTQESLALINPISAELAVMRTSLWPGLLDTAIRNINRQQGRIRIFESGLKFVQAEGELTQPKSVALLAMGPVHDEQWGERARMIDFFDIKADVEAIVHLTGRDAGLEFRASQHPALHPGQSAEIVLNGHSLGWIGMLHPNLERELGLDRRVFLVELDQTVLTGRDIPKFSRLSRFPSVRRDLAFIVDRTIASADMVECVTGVTTCQGILRDVIIFDIYAGEGIGQGKQSVGLGLIFQDDTETLVDAVVDATVQDVVEALGTRFDARLRE